MKEARFCSQCKALIVPNEANCCSICGIGLEKYLKCKCSREMHQDYNFCPNCGRHAPEKPIILDAHTKEGLDRIVQEGFLTKEEIEEIERNLIRLDTIMGNWDFDIPRKKGDPLAPHLEKVDRAIKELEEFSKTLPPPRRR